MAMADFTTLAGRTVLVTGGRGFLGSNLCGRLSELGVELHATTTARPPEDPAGVRWHRVEFSDVSDVRDLLDQLHPEIIFHLAGHGVGAPGLEQVLPTFQHDLAGTVNLLTAVAERKTTRRVILAASLEEPTPSDAHIPPATPYAAAKWASGEYARMFHALYETPVVRVRPFMAYGPGQRTHKLIPHVILALLQGQSPKLSSGQRPVDWVYVGDVMEGMIAAALVPGIEGRTFDLGSGELVPIRAVVEKLVEITGASAPPRFGALPDRPMERVRVADTAPADESLGWKSVTSLDAGLKKTVFWYEKELRKTAEVRA
jgi:nucleoside-diphosphate-sugar epimerase